MTCRSGKSACNGVVGTFGLQGGCCIITCLYRESARQRGLADKKAVEIYKSQEMQMHKLTALFLLSLLALTANAASAPVMVSTQWLAKHINDKHLVVLDMSSDDTQYARFHLPGAVRMPYYSLMLRKKRGEKFSKRISDEALAHNLGLMGISQSNRIIIYDDMGGLEAARLFWHLDRLGHNNVSVLDGGLVKWILEGRKVDNRQPARRNKTSYGPLPAKRDNEAGYKDVKQASEKGTALLIDARTVEEYIGDKKRKRGGHVPGAIWWPWQQAVDMRQGFTLKSDKTLADLFRQKNITDKSRPIITYCRSGHRAAHTYLALRHLGYKNVKLYVNSMNEYEAVKRGKLKLGRNP